MLPRPRLLCALVAALACLGSGIAVTSAPAAAASGPSVRIDMESVTPYVDPSTKQVRISGRVVNNGNVPLWTVNAMLWVNSTPLTTRRALSEAAAEQPGDRLGVRLDEPWNLVDEVATTLEPRESAKFDVVVPVTELKLTTAGVYAVGVDVRATPPNSNARDTWRARSFLPYVPKDTRMTPVEVSFLLPVTESPSLVSGDLMEGSAATQSATTFVGEPNPQEFGPNGRLTRLLQLGSAHGLSFVVDPELLAEAEHMADGYTTSADQKITPAQAADVRRWLNRARGIFAAGHTLMLPYADPDLTALQKYRLTDRFGRAVSSAKESVKKYEASGTLAWPGTGYADATTLETIAASGAKTVLLSSRSLPRLPGDGSSPVASLSTQEGALTALVADPTLTAGAFGNSGPANVQQRFLAEAALLAMQGGGSPAAQRRVVAAFPRNWNPGTGGSVLFSTVESTPWLRPVKAGALLSQAPTAYGGPVLTSAADQRAALNPEVVSHLRQLSATTDTLLDLLAEPDRSRPDLDRALLRGTSMAWRHDPRQAIDLIDSMDANMRAEIGQVTVVRPRLVTLSSQTGRFPITVSNEGDQPVQVQLEVSPRDADMLSVEPIDPVRVDGHRKATVSVTAATTGGGSVQMEVRLATRSGTEFGNPETFQVKVTGYGQVGWAVIGVGLGLMLLAAGARIIRRARAAVLGRRRTAADVGVVTAEATLGDAAGAAEIAVDAGAAGRSPAPPAPAEPIRLNGQVRVPSSDLDPGSDSADGADTTDGSGTGDRADHTANGAATGDPADSDPTRAQR